MASDPKAPPKLVWKSRGPDHFDLVTTTDLVHAEAGARLGELHRAPGFWVFALFGVGTFSPGLDRIGGPSQHSMELYPHPPNPGPSVSLSHRAHTPPATTILLDKCLQLTRRKLGAKALRRAEVQP